LITSGKSRGESQIHLVATIEGNEIFYYSGHRISPENFIKEKVILSNSAVYIQQAKKNTFNKAGVSASVINARLKELDNAALSVFEKHYKGREFEIFSKEDFKKYLREELGEQKESDNEKAIINQNLPFFDIYELYISDKNGKVSKERMKHLKSDKNKLTAYSSYLKHELNEHNFDPMHYKNYLKKDEGLSENTAVCLLKRLRAFFNHAKKKKYISSNPFSEIDFAEEIGREAYDEPVCMSREELAQLYNTKFENKEFELTKDMFCLQAAFGCRVGDFLRLTVNNLQNNQVVYYPQKTTGGNDVLKKIIVPVSERAKEIINKYKKDRRRDELLMPFLNSSDYNENIKAVFRIAGLDRVIVQYDRDEKKEKFFKLYELASSHLARKTFIDILCQAGEPLHVVASMSGHSEKSKAFDRYRRRPEQLQKTAVARSMD